MNPKLTQLAKTINEREETIELAKTHTIKAAAAAVTEALLQGRELIQAKSLCPRGQWEAWLQMNCPRIGLRSAQRRMALAFQLPKNPQLTEAGSLRAALALCEMEGLEKEQTEPRRWPPYLEAINRLGKLALYFDRFPIDKWPEVGVEKFKADLEPIARRLWPEKFAQTPPAKESILEGNRQKQVTELPVVSRD